MKIINVENSIIKSWCENPEEGALEQAKNLIKLPFRFKHVALMPDTHQGYGMPIGGVLATENVIIPNAVGVDIGCGMCALRTSLKEIDTETLKKIMGEIRKQIPVGFNHNKEKQDESLMPNYQGVGKLANPPVLDTGECEFKSHLPDIVKQEYQNALYSLGTLGGGNHFIEIQKGDDGYIWIMIHSGSRNIGFTVANYYNKVAIDLNTKWRSLVPKEHQLAFLPIESREGKDYQKEMQYCVDFALANRKLMMDRIKLIFAQELKLNENNFDEMINIAHNYASIENHFGKNVFIHRKGATLATEKTIGIIPGSQGTSSYIVKGKGNPDSYNSCSHGAGRKMGRKDACRRLNLEEEIKRLDDLGVIHGIRHINDLDEASGAYKDIDVVMEEQKDLVDILVKLTPLAVIKG